MSELKVDTGTLSHIANSGPVSILAYCASSILMTVTNKFVVGSDGFNMLFVMLFAQSLVCVTALVLLKALGYVRYRPLNKVDVKNWLPISVLLVLMTYTSSRALKYLAVPIYTIFKNLTIILIAYGEVLFFGGRVTAMELSSFLLIVLSSVVATLGDQQALAKKPLAAAAESILGLNVGYFWMFTNCICSALFVLIMRKRIALTKFKDFDTMFYNNILSLPLLMLASLLFEDWGAENVGRNLTKDYIVVMIISGLASVGISYCSGWCVRVTSSTTYSMVGALNKLPIALSGLIFFDAPKNFLSIFSIFLGFLSGIVYAVAKQKKQSQPAN
ncbi:AaceriAFR236Cp [[Ashbya] aceris (nom. inval.)]|nr:AaceriAFR236Cp [[Ashbya] aceris (nom. inval.)]